MARIIRTSPNKQKKLSLRVVLSLLLFLQIQIPNAQNVTQAPEQTASFQDANQSSFHLALARHKHNHTALLLPEKGN